MCTEFHALRDEGKLIELIVSGKTDLFYDLIRPHEHRIRRVALAVVRNDADAEDVVQETFLKAFLNLSSFRADSRLSTWLISIALNEAKGQLRRRGLLAFESTEACCDRFWHATGEGSDPYQMAEQAQVNEIILRALAGLHPRYRNIYFLREVHELSTQRAAEQLGISLPVAKTRLHRARRLLQERLNVLMGNPMKRGRHTYSISIPRDGSSPAAATRCKSALNAETSEKKRKPVEFELSRAHRVAIGDHLRSAMVYDVGIQTVGTGFTLDAAHA
jgi:RNA polymerase sigma-70 factor (ECF subfamily)